LAHWFVKDLMVGLENNGHVIVMDNYFTSVGLFRNLEWRGIYAIETMRFNKVDLHLDMKKIKECKRRMQGNLKWFMHELRRMCSVL
jgi:hypothetical protein